jgi:hypothetical protein
MSAIVVYEFLVKIGGYAAPSIARRLEAAEALADRVVQQQTIRP